MDRSTCIGVLPLGSTGSSVFLAYALIPWIGVMMAGFALGSVFSWEDESRRRILLSLGLAITVLFFAIRLINVYGDPVHWSTRTEFLQRPAAERGPGDPGASPSPRPETNETYTLLSFFNVSKYPPSLLFLLMTLGPGLIVLAFTDRISGTAIWQKICLVFGRVPMFYYLLQWAWAHGAAVVLAYFAGTDTSYLFMDLFQMGQNAPPDHGFSLPVVYAVWIVGLIVVYPLCLWFGGVKQRNRHPLLSYL